MIELRKSEKRLMDYIDFYWQNNYHSPSTQEILAAGISRSSSHVIILASSLVSKGYLIPRAKGSIRSFVPAWVKVLIDSQSGDRRRKFILLLQKMKEHPQPKNRAGV